MDTTITINKEDLEIMKEKTQQARIIALHNMRHHPLINTNSFTKLEKKELISKVKHILLYNTDEERIKQFNEIVNDELLDPKSDYTKYPVYLNRSNQQQVEDYEKTEKELEELKKI